MKTQLMDDDYYFELLAKNYPDLIKKSRQEYFGVGAGWFNIINVLCGAISRDVTQIRYKLGYMLENPDSKHSKTLDEIEAELAAAIEALPVIDQIKEKFGSLRFYYHGGADHIDHYVRFAESLCGHTCETCGAPGESRNDGWVKVRCDKHQKEHEAESNFRGTRKKTAPKLSDE